MRVARVAFYFAAILTFAGALWWYNHQRQVRLGADPVQQRLAEALVAAAQGGSKAAVTRLLADGAHSAADRRVRLTHAVLLVRGQVTPQVYAQVLALSREL